MRYDSFQKPTQPNQGSLEARVLTANFVGGMSSGILSLARPLFVFGATGSLTMTSLVALSSAIPGLIVQVVGSPQVDRLDRHKIIVVSSIVSALLTFFIPWLFATWGVSALMVISLISAVFGAVEAPALSAALPVLFGDRYQAFISKKTSISFFIQAISPVVGGALVTFIGARFTIMIGALLIALYAILIGAIPNFDPTYNRRSKAARETSQISYLRDGFIFAKNNPVLRSLFGFWFISLTAVPLGVSAALPYITEVKGGSSFQFGIISGLYGLGAVVGSLVAGKLKFPGGTRKWLIMAGLVYGTVNLVTFSQPGLLLFGLLWLVWGLAYGPEEVIENVAFVKVVPPEMQGRMYALMGVVMSIAGLVGTALVGPISDNLGPHLAMTLAGIVFILATVICFIVGKGGKILASINIAESN